ncbi:DUF4231 domain-containing protein [Streptomyces sp. NPDC021080]|uniref:DUF4231 domain-containing protein n=1 Tax=Streptomyces sp. NPDC021080 TaxID=3365110 RepID=UPI0037885933
MEEPESLTDPEQWFLGKVESALAWARKKAFRRERIYYRSRICSLAFSTGVVVAAATPIPRWGIAALGGVSAIIEGSLQVTGYREQMLSIMDFRSRLEVELTLYRTHSAPYNDEDVRLAKFVERVERIFRDSDESQVSILQQPINGGETGNNTRLI